MSQRFKISLESAEQEVQEQSESVPELEGDDYIDGVLDTLSQEQLRIAIEDEFVETCRVLDTVDNLVNLNDVASKITTPTETDLQLLDIVESMSRAGTDAEPGDIVPSIENFSDYASAITEKIIAATQSIGSSVANIFKAFAKFLKKLSFNFKSWRGQLLKLNSILVNLKSKASRSEVTIEVKNDAHLWTGTGSDYSIVEIKDSKELNDSFSEYSNRFEAFTLKFAESLFQHQERYVEAFTTLFKGSNARIDLFFAELQQFSDLFINKLVKEGELKIEEKKGLTVINRTPVMMGGTYFKVTSPSDAIYKLDNVDTVLRSFDEFVIESANVSFNPNAKGKKRDITINLDDVSAILKTVANTIDIFEVINNEKISRVIDDMYEFADLSVRAARFDTETNEETIESKVNRTIDAGKIAFKKTNAVARLQVMQAHIVIAAYSSIYDSIDSVMNFTNSFCYDVLNRNDWYEQDIAI